MSWANRLFGRQKQEKELEEEVRTHLEMAAKDRAERGKAAREAEHAVRREFGNVGLVKETTRDVWGWRWIEDFVEDARYGSRTLRKNLGFAAVAVLTLALGIGANTAIFSLIDNVLLRPLPVRDPDSLVVLKWRGHSGPSYHGYSDFGFCHIDQAETERAGCSFSYPFFDQLRSRTNVFSSVTAFAGNAGGHLSGNGAKSKVSNALVSGEFFETLGVTAAVGRTLRPADDTPSSEPVAVLNYSYWQSAFGGDRSVVGKTIYLERIPVTIVGVADPNFTSLVPGNTQDMWLPLVFCARLKPDWSGSPDDPGNGWLTIVGRLKERIRIAQSQTAVSLFFRNEMLHGATAMSNEADDPRITLVPVQKGLAGSRWIYEKPLHLLMVAVGIVLLIACSNVAGLMLARGATRQKEMAVRLALGASRARIIRQLLTESVLLSLVGGTVGVMIAYWSLTALRSANWLGSIDFAVIPDGRVLAFTVFVSLMAGIVPGLAPAFHGTRIDLAPALKENAPTLPGVPPHHRWFGLGSMLVVTQVALSMLVLIGAGLLVRTLVNLKSIDPGFDANNLLLVGIDPTDSGYKDDQARNLYRDLQGRFSMLPGVVSVTYSSDILLSGNTWTRTVLVEGPKERLSMKMNMLLVGPRFFDTMRISLVAGRAFTPSDFDSMHKVTIVNQAFVRRYFKDRSPLGLHLGGSGTKDPGEEIIGVVGDAKYDDLRKDIEPTSYVPLKDGAAHGAHFELRTTAVNQDALIPAVQSIVSGLDSHLPRPDFKTETEQIDRSLFRERLIARLSSFFGLLALVLACVGLYGMLSYEVARRTREIGIRTALGAQQRDVLRIVVKQGLALAVVGAVLGVAVALGVTRYLQTMLYGVHPADPITLAAVAFGFAVVALAACYVPARRAMKVDPIVALKYE
jgi:predicted permease